jgi:hypothetical protein
MENLSTTCQQLYLTLISNVHVLLTIPLLCGREENPYDLAMREKSKTNGTSTHEHGGPIIAYTL